MRTLSQQCPSPVGKREGEQPLTFSTRGAAWLAAAGSSWPSPLVAVPLTRMSSTRTARPGMVKPNSCEYLRGAMTREELLWGAALPSPRPPEGGGGTHRAAKEAPKSPVRQEAGVARWPLAEHIRAQSVRS